MSKAKVGTFQELLDVAAADVRPIVEAARKLVLSVDPDTTEVVRLGDGAASYGVGPKKMKEGYVYVMPHASHVNLGFYQGASLNDPKGLLEGTGAKMRHVKLRSVKDVARCRALVTAAVPRVSSSSLMPRVPSAPPATAERRPGASWPCPRTAGHHR